MTHRLVHVLVLLLLVGTSVNAQQRADFSIKQRAQSLEPYFLDSANRYGIDPRILRVLCYLESRFRVTAISPKGARGPMQFMPKLRLDMDSAIHTIQRQQLMPQPDISAIYCVNSMEGSISLLPLITQVKAQLRFPKWTCPSIVERQNYQCCKVGYRRDSSVQRDAELRALGDRLTSWQRADNYNAIR
jgi:hypothetical protein